MENIPHAKPIVLPALICAAIVLVSMAAGFFMGKFSTPQETPDTETRLFSSSYHFTNPLLDYQPAPPTLVSRDIRELDESLQDFIQSEVEKEHVVSASVYYRDLENGPWISVNGEEKYTPASLLKVPLLIAYYKQAEKNPSILADRITYEKEYPDIPYSNIDNIPSSVSVGQTYSVSELIDFMIKDSDNIAALLLEQHIDGEQAEQVFLDFDIPLPDFLDPRKGNTTTRQYAGFFRILYNGTYLSKDYSEQALSLLTKTHFADGLVAGVPTNVPVSHKFGVSSDDTNLKQLHDCGIIYDETIRTYTLCVMTSGTDYAQMAKVIADISALVHTTLRSTMSQ